MWRNKERERERDGWDPVLLLPKVSTASTETGRNWGRKFCTSSEKSVGAGSQTISTTLQEREPTNESNDFIRSAAIMSSVSGEPRHPPVVSSVCTDHGIYSGTLVDPISANLEHGQHRRLSASSSSSSVTDTSDPAVRRVVYNLYRGLLGTYNDKANDIISAMPPEMVREDHGIAKHIESMM